MHNQAFIFGKFLPFHKGHEAMIRFALQHCTSLTVLICCSDCELIPGTVRRAWIEDTIQDERLTVTTYDYNESALPNTSVSSASVSAIWAEVFSKLLPGHNLLITSEPYGDMVAAAMGISHLPFDMGRTCVPISATTICGQLHKYWHYLPHAVKRTLARKVVINGTESTGKSTLAQSLATHYGCTLVTEAGRDIVADSKDFHYGHLEEIAREHAQRIAEATTGPGPLVIIDTDVHITMSYAWFTFGRPLSVPQHIYDENRANLCLYLNADAPYQQDGTRLHEQERNALDISHRNVLASCGIEILEITGGWQERLATAINAIDAISPFTLKVRTH